MLIQERTILSVIRAGIYAILFLPLVIIPWLFFPFSTSKGFLFQIIVEIIFALYLAVAIKNPAYRPKKTLLIYAVSFYFLTLLLSAIFGLDPYHSFFGNYERMWGVFQLTHFFLFFIILAGVFKSRGEWTRLLKIALFSGALTVGVGLFQIIISLVDGNGIPRISSVIGNPAFLAGYLLFPLFFSPLFLPRLSLCKNYIGLAYAGLSFLSLFIILVTATRGAFVALGAALAVAVVLAALFLRNKVLKIIAVVFLLSAIVGGGALLKYGSLFQKPVKISQEQYYDISRLDAPAEQSAGAFGFLSRLTKFSLYDTTTQTRLITWKSALGALHDYPLLGIGPENFVLAFNKYFSPDFYSYEKSEVWFDRAHNIYIDALAETGPVGLAAYLLVFTVCFYAIFQLYRRQKINLAHLFILTLFFVAYAAQNIFLFDSSAPFLMFIFVIAYLNSYNITEAKPMRIGLASVNARIFITPLILAGVIIYLFNIKPLSENYRLAQAESGKYGIDRTMEYYKEALDYNTFGNNEARSRMALTVARAVQAEESEHLSPNLAKYLDFAIAGLEQNIKQSNDYYLLYRLQLADLYNLKLSRTAQASPEIEDIIKKSITISPGRMEFEFALAQAEFLKDNFSEAIRILTEASKKNPDHPMPYWKISQNYHFMGNDDNPRTQRAEQSPYDDNPRTQRAEQSPYDDNPRTQRAEQSPYDDKAIQFLEEAFYRGQSVKNPKEIMWAEQYYVKKENYSKIIFIDNLLLDQSPDQKETVRLHINLAVAYAKLGRKDKAIEHANRVEEIDPSQKSTVAAFLQAL